MGRNKKYPYYLKKIELNKTTDQNFYKILNSKSYIQVSLPYDGNCIIQKFTPNVSKYTTDKDFSDQRSFINSSEEEYNHFLNIALLSFGIKNNSFKKTHKSNKGNICVIAKITATIEQLAEIGIDEDIRDMEVEVYDIDKYDGINAPCSRVVVDDKFDHLTLNIDYIVPTKWLSFKK